ncbi:hypothetical protein RN001_005171 [Aquatica leii]|uniref:Uncharacterized protein n=1 Tax=Aquatica leii TaxID=1421715 RepID=A0AAN7SHS2_9COLE|nr:hypothetical protein RN001_005171 [Aquatica leii]
MNHNKMHCVIHLSYFQQVGTGLKRFTETDVTTMHTMLAFKYLRVKILSVPHKMAVESVMDKVVLSESRIGSVNLFEKVGCIYHTLNSARSLLLQIFDFRFCLRCN